MAEANISVDQDQFRCSVCLDLLKHPVTIPCGHTYCKRCISECWDQEDRKRIYSCPQCRRTFSPRPVLGKNVVFAEMVEKLKKTRLQAAPVPVPARRLHRAGSGDVQCGSCTGIKQKARSAQSALEDSERIFTELIRSIEKRHSEVKQLIRDQERAAVSRAEEQLERLKKEIDDLKRKDAELKQLSDTDDHIHFLQSLSSASLSGSTEGVTGGSHMPFDDVIKSVSQLRDKLQQFFRETMENISGTVKTIQIIQTPEYDTRQEFLQYFHQLSLDPNTVHPCLHLSEGNTAITYTNTFYAYPDHPERFDYAQALCRESVTGRCYWEVEYSGSEGVYVAVAYKSIGRKGQSLECAFGCNNQSWILFSSPSMCSFSHNNINSNLPLVSSSRIGVFVDHRAGVLSFYSVSDTMSLIHRVQTTFTQPLCPGFGLGLYSTAKLCRLRN
uniref:Tripartite motif-containing protein 16-like n=1 Tax=Cyprinus carpio TaxID=7962 RepID=A0A8C1XP68_CYPCA